MSWIAHVLIAAATLVVGPVALAAALARPRWRAGLGERLRPPGRRTDRPVWIHVASVGEAAAAAPLVDAIGTGGRASTSAPPAGSDALPLLLTAQTVTGRARLAARHPGIAVRLAPLDHPWLARLALRRVRPRAIVLVETEVWPCLVAAAAARGIPVVVVSGRLSARAFRLQHELAPLFTRTFGRLAAVGARSAADAERFVALGTPAARVRVTGDLKWAKPPGRDALAPEVRAFMTRRPTVVLGSTHAGETPALLEAVRVVARDRRDVQWLWAPRHPDEADALVRSLDRAGLRSVRRSTLDAAGGATGAVAADVLVLDTLGELSAAWSHGLVAVVGGTFDATGGHDLLEPVQAGRPVVFGPSTAGVADVARALVDAGAAARVRGGAELGGEILRLLDSAPERSRRVARGTALLEAGRSALDANVRLVLDTLRRPPGATGTGERAPWNAPRGIYARGGPGGGRLARVGLRLASSLYGLGARLDRATARLGTRRPARLPCAVVSVGSLLAGGAAKTPVTIWLARALRARGRRVVVVTRGHGVALGRHRVEIASHGAGPCAPVERVGDEALVIARAVPDVPVLVGRDRHRAGLVAVAELGAEVVLLDDGFQHFALERDVDLVCLDAAIGVGNGRVLPAGPLREPARALARADALVVTDGPLDERDARVVEAHAAGLRRLAGERRAQGWRDLRTGAHRSLDALVGRRAGLLAGLADPASFAALAARHGVAIGGESIHPDHHAYTRADVAAIARRGRIWVTTEKDAVHIDPRWLPEGLELYALEMEWVPDDPELLLDLVERGCGWPVSGEPGATRPDAPRRAAGARRTAPSQPLPRAAASAAPKRAGRAQ